MVSIRPSIHIASALLIACSLTSCDKVTDVIKQGKQLAGIKASADIDQVTQSKGEKLIKKESRLVVVEYYLDT